MTSDPPLQSPCTGVCQLHAISGYCLGCWRTGDEIAAWPTMDNGQKRAVLDGLHGRREQAGGGARRATARRRQS